MKKYLLGLFAVGLAVGLSSFSVTKNKAKKESKLSQDYYWYNVDPNNDFKTTTLAFPDPHTETYMLANLTSCTDVPTNDPCLSGYTNTVSAGEPLPSDEGEIIRRQN